MADAPTITSAVANSPGWITIAWAHSGQDGVLGYRLQRQTPAAAWVTNNNVGQHTDMGLQASTSYSYSVCAVFPGGAEMCSPWVTVMTMPPEPPRPPASRPPPTLTAHEVTQHGITVKWSGRTYDRVHIRWRRSTPGSSPLEAQVDIDHDQPVGYRHFPNLEVGTPYAFRIQGCDVNFIGVANCGPWSAPPVQISTAGPVLPAVPPQVAPIYAVLKNGDLLWNRHEGHADGDGRWALANSRQVGNGWNVLHAFSGGEGIIYAVQNNGELVWNRHDGRGDGTPNWALVNSRPVGTGWHGAAHVFAAAEGVIYAIYNDGRVIWNRHLGRGDGTFRWELPTGRNVANAVNKMVFFRAARVFAGGTPGLIYVLLDDGDLLWFRHDGWWDGSPRWSFDDGKTVGVGWRNHPTFVLRDTTYVYAVNDSRELLWNIHVGWNDGTFRWALPSSTPVGSGWDVAHAFSG